MNKQEAIEKIRELDLDGSSSAESKKAIIPIVSQIDEPQKVVVPKFVAEWIKSQKESFSGVSAIDMYDNLNLDNRGGYYHEVWLWVIAHHHDFIKAWHDGYEIEQEKLYTVEIPNPNGTTEPIIYLSRDERGNIFLNSWLLFASQSWKKHPHSHLTESEIKQDFEWAWKWAKEVENKCK